MKKRAAPNISQRHEHRAAPNTSPTRKYGTLNINQPSYLVCLTSSHPPPPPAHPPRFTRSKRIADPRGPVQRNKPSEGSALHMADQASKATDPLG
jgi:hypothetical protein